MTTKITILNHGPKAVHVEGGSGTPATLQPGDDCEVHLWDESGLTVTEVAADGPTPNLAGGPGEEGP